MNAKIECELLITKNKFSQIDLTTDKNTYMRKVHVKKILDMSKRYTSLLESWMMLSYKLIHVETINVPINVRFDLQSAIKADRMK